jgi:hypothetical protein
LNSSTKPPPPKPDIREHHPGKASTETLRHLARATHTVSLF